MIPFWLGAGYHMYRESQRGRGQSTMDYLDEIEREFDEACKPIMDECARLAEQEAREQGLNHKQGLNQQRVNQNSTTEDFPEIDLTFEDVW